MKVLGSNVCTYMCWAKGKHFVRKCCDPAGSQCLHWLMIAFITWNITLELLLEGLCSSNPCRFEFSVIWVFAGLCMQIRVVLVLRSNACGARGALWEVRGVYRALPVLVWRVRSSQGLAGRARLLRIAGYCVCCCDYTLCDRERQPSESRVWSTAGTVILPTNMTRNHNKLPSTGQGPGGANRTSGGKLPNQAAGPREVVEQ